MKLGEETSAAALNQKTFYWQIHKRKGGQGIKKIFSLPTTQAR